MLIKYAIDNDPNNVDIREQQNDLCNNSHLPVSNYVNLVAIDEAGRVMVIEDLTTNGGWGCWHLISSGLTEKDNPMAVGQHKLLLTTGYSSANWLYLGSFALDVNNPEAAEHFLVAQNVTCVHTLHQSSSQTCAVKWISQRQLRYALLDGRLGSMRDALTATMALLTLLPNLPKPLSNISDSHPLDYRR